MKMKKSIIVFFILFYLITIAWEKEIKAKEIKLKGPQILNLLNGAKIKGDSFSQTFTEEGDTYYVDERPSRGRWKVVKDQYCSIWQSTLDWDCYDVIVDKKNKLTTIIWVNATGKRIISYLVK